MELIGLLQLELRTQEFRVYAGLRLMGPSGAGGWGFGTATAWSLEFRSTVGAQGFGLRVEASH